MQPTDQTSTERGLSVGCDCMQIEKGERTGFGVALETQHDLWSTVPSRRNVFGHVPRVLLRVDREPTRQAKVADFQLAIGIDQQVTGLQVSVQDIGGMDVLQPA